MRERERERERARERERERERDIQRKSELEDALLKQIASRNNRIGTTTSHEYGQNCS